MVIFVHGDIVVAGHMPLCTSMVKIQVDSVPLAQINIAKWQEKMLWFIATHRVDVYSTGLFL